jgi:hypothetical protein
LDNTGELWLYSGGELTLLDVDCSNPLWGAGLKWGAHDYMFDMYSTQPPNNGFVLDMFVYWRW